MSYALATDGFVGFDYQAATRGYVDLSFLFGGRPGLVVDAGRPPAFVSVVASRLGETVATITALPAQTAPVSSSGASDAEAPIVSVTVTVLDDTD